MKKISMKRALTLVMALCMIVSAFAAFGCVNASADSHFVNMYFAETYSSTHGASTRHIYVQTDGNASNQQVSVHYYTANGNTWLDDEGEYVKTLSDGSKLWKVSIIQYGGGSDYDYNYAIKYVADGHTYWNNNNGQNFKEEDLGVAPITVQRRFYRFWNAGSHDTITAVLQNYAYHKNVFVRVTNDGWKSYTDIPMSYSETNDDGTENWTVDFSRTAENAEDFEYCVCYQANGQTYWANNLGENYGANFRIYQ